MTSFGPDTLFRNNGDGTFTDVTKQAGVSDPLLERQRRFRRLRPRRRPRSLRRQLPRLHARRTTSGATTRVGARDYCSPRAYRPVPDRLYRNEGGGRFTDVTEAAGISKADGAGLGVSTGDYNGDGWLDLYVANDATPNQLWINQRNGTFVDEGLLSGSALNAAGNPEGSMGIASGDFDVDGDEDLFVTNIVGETFALYVNDGQRQLRRCAGQGGSRGADRGVHRLRHRLVRLRQRRLARSLHRQRRGQHRRSAARREVPVPDAEPVVSQHRRAAGSWTTSKAGGPAFARAEIGRGAAFGDLDNDGDIDVVVTNNNGPVRLLLNQAGRQNHWLQVGLAAGGRATVSGSAPESAWSVPDGRPLWRRVRTDGSYLLGQRRARPLRPRHVGQRVGCRRRMARWSSRAVDGRLAWIASSPCGAGLGNDGGWHLSTKVPGTLP